MSESALPLAKPGGEKVGLRKKPGLVRSAIRRAVAVLRLVLTAPLWLPLLVLTRRTAIVTIRLQGAVAEESGRTSRIRRMILGEEKLSFLDALLALEQAEKDARVQAVFVELDRAGISLVHADELAQAIARLRAANKKVLAWIEDASGPGLRLAAAADRAVAPPAGMLAFMGIRARFTFLKGGLEQAGIVGEMEHVGPWKTASDTFTRRDFTPEHRAMLEDLTSDLHRQTVDAIARGRGIDRAAVDAALADAPIDHPRAVAQKLLDRTSFRDEVDAETRTLLGLSEDASLPRSADATTYLGRARRRKRVANALRERPLVAFVPLTGAIISGDEAPSAGGKACASRALAEVLEALRDRKDVVATVLRIDSPGGSAEASDEIWRAVKRLDEECPVIASMGRVAASGGYYSACGARWIVAHPATITGSIGVVTGKVHAAPLLSKLGIALPEIATAPRAGMFEPDRPFTEEERAAVRREMFRVYDTFLDRAAEARRKTRDEIDALGRGRVYTGRRALELGLVDELGGLGTAIERAKTIAGYAPGTEHRLGIVRPRPKRTSALPFSLSALGFAVPELATELMLLSRERVLLWEPLDISGT